MESLPLPKTFKFIKEEGNESVFILEPCYPGYGVTIGNALRRVLLSSLPGAAVTSMKIKGVDHEFSTVPNVKEDVVEIILNLKKLCLRSHSSEPVKLELKVKGDKKITAGMFTKSDQIEIINPDMHIATLDGKTAELEMELTVEQGRGYVPVESREEEKNEIGMIAIDSIYTPVRNVNFTVDNVRVGKITNFDRLTLYITTNGTITGREALDQTARLLVDHFSLLLKENFERAEMPVISTSQEESAGEASIPEVTPAESDEGLLSLNLSRRSYNALLKNGITTVGKLRTMTAEDLKSIQGLGEKSINEILDVIKSL